MLRQANDQLEKTMKEKQELEDFIKQSTEDSSHQVSDAREMTRLLKLHLKLQRVFISFALKIWQFYFLLRQKVFTDLSVMFFKKEFIFLNV